MKGSDDRNMRDKPTSTLLPITLLKNIAPCIPMRAGGEGPEYGETQDTKVRTIEDRGNKAELSK